MLVSAGCDKSTTPEPTAEPAAEAEAETETEAEAEPTAEEKEAAERAERLAKRFAELDEARDAEAARWTDEMKADAKTLAESKFRSTKKALPKILAGSHRSEKNVARDAMRHPKETITFFGITPKMTVVEAGPGAGWYTEILAPLLAAQGKLVVDTADPDGPETEGSTFYGRRLKYFLESNSDLYGKVETIVSGSENAPYGAAESADAVLIFRGLHGNVRRGDGSFEEKIAAAHKTLKAGGILGIVQHRAAEGADVKEAAEKGYVGQAWMIENVEKAGFKLADKSEVNANEKDTHDHPEGVWSLPPTLTHGDEDRAKYEAIGESDRMTLRFEKQ
jgi:predicted methyltransferase